MPLGPQSNRTATHSPPPPPRLPSLNQLDRIPQSEFITLTISCLTSPGLTQILPIGSHRTFASLILYLSSVSFLAPSLNLCIPSHTIVDSIPFSIQEFYMGESTNTTNVRRIVSALNLRSPDQMHFFLPKISLTRPNMISFQDRVFHRVRSLTPARMW